MNETDLDLGAIGIVPQSARSLGQTLSKIKNGSRRRMANGALRDRSRPSLDKFQSTINFSDTYPPAFDNIEQGDVLLVSCVAELSGMAGKPFGRLPVPGSVIWRTTEGHRVPSGPDETVAPEGAAFYTYKPILEMMVDGWDVDTDEYGAIVTASLVLMET